MSRTRAAVAGAVLAASLGLAAAVLHAGDLRHDSSGQADRLLYLQSGPAARRLMLSFSAVAADVYWIRTIQHYGTDLKSRRTTGRFELLDPLLNLTTTLDPDFTIAYRFGAIFLALPEPHGPGRPDLAVALLEKGLAHHPGKWQYALDLGFTHYWFTNDFAKAGQWFAAAATMPNAPVWIQPLAAATLAQGGDRQGARELLRHLLDVRSAVGEGRRRTRPPPDRRARSHRSSPGCRRRVRRGPSRRFNDLARHRARRTAPWRAHRPDGRAARARPVFPYSRAVRAIDAWPASESREASVMTAGIAIIGMFGLMVGSFLNVCISRLPAGESIAFPGSRCPRCHAPIHWYDNIPVVSFLVLGGKCRACHLAISPRYPLVELATGLAFTLQAVVVGPDPLLLASRLVFTAMLVVLFGTDLETQRLPNVVTLPGAALGVISSALLPPGLVASLLGLALGAGVLLLIRWAWMRAKGVDAMGLGDVKMLALIGAFLGWQQVIVVLFVGSVTGALLGVALAGARGRSMQSKLPFGTFLAVAAFFASLWGEPLVHWYLHWYE